MGYWPVEGVLIQKIRLIVSARWAETPVIAAESHRKKAGSASLQGTSVRTFLQGQFERETVNAGRFARCTPTVDPTNPGLQASVPACKDLPRWSA